MIDPVQAELDRLLRRRAAFPHWMQERVRWSDTDKIGHVNNLAFAAFFETGRSHFMVSQMQPVISGGAMPVVARLSVNYLGELHWPDEVDIGTGVLDFGRSSCRIGQALFIGDRCYATAESVVVLIDESTRRSIEIPEASRQALAGFLIQR